jgi:hypothetical protein
MRDEPAPTISAFFGIVIRMYYGDHPPSHFHAFYQDHEALVSIDTLEVIAGHFPRRGLELISDWTELHRNELRDNWRRAEEHMLLQQIPPLE